MFEDFKSAEAHQKLYCFDFDQVIVDGFTNGFFMMQGIDKTESFTESEIANYFHELERYVKLKHPKKLLACIKEIFINGDKIAITSFNNYGWIIPLYLKSLGLTYKEIESIHIEYGKCPSTEEHKILGKSIHIQNAMEYFNIKEHQNIIIIDRDKINIDIAKKSGHQAILVPKGLADKSYFNHLPSTTPIPSCTKLYCFDFDETIIHGYSAPFFVMLNIEPNNKISEEQALEYQVELQRYIKLKHQKELFSCMKGIFENNDKIAITSFNDYGGVIILPYLKSLGLTYKEIESIHIEYGRCPNTKKEHESIGKSLHIQGAMQHFGIVKKSNVILIDDCPTNTKVALEFGYNAVLVPRGILDKSYFNHLPKATKIYILQNDNFLLSLFLLKEIIENSATMHYLFYDITLPLIFPMSNKSITQSIEKDYYFMTINTLFIGIHAITNCAAIPFFYNKGLSLNYLISTSLLSTTIYTGKIALIDLITESKSNLNLTLNNSIQDPIDFINKCSNDILISIGFSGSNIIANKLIIPEIGWNMLGIEIFSHSIIGGIQCYINYKNLKDNNNEKKYTDFIFPYLVDIAYLMKFSSAFSYKFNNIGEGLFVIKKNFMLLNGLILTDYLSKLTINIIPDSIVDSYINTPVESFIEKIDNLKTTFIELTYDLYEIILYPNNEDIKEEL